MADGTYCATIGNQVIAARQHNMPAVTIAAVGWARRGYTPAIHRGPEEGVVRVRHVDGYLAPAYEPHPFNLPAPGIPAWAESIMTLIQQSNPKETTNVARDPA